MAFRVIGAAEPESPSEQPGLGGNIERMLRQAGWPEEEVQRRVADITGRIPQTTGEVAGMALPWLIGKAIPTGRTVTRIGGQVLGNILGRGTVGVGEALASGEDVSAGGLTGMAKGFLPGLVQGTLGGILGPGRSTIRAQKEIDALKKAVSPELAKVLDPTKPAALLSAKTTKKMQEAASSNIDDLESTLGGELEGFAYKTVVPGTTRTVGIPFEAIRARIKDLRKEAGLKRFAKGDESLAQKAREANRDARLMEIDLAKQMTDQGFEDQAKRYLEGIAQYRKDSDAIRYLKALQPRVPGGAIAQDNPELAKAAKLRSAQSPLAPLVHGTLGTAEAATGRSIGAAYHLGRVMDMLRARGPLMGLPETAPLRPPMVPGALGGSMMSGAQTLLGEYPFSDRYPSPLGQ